MFGGRGAVDLKSVRPGTNGLPESTSNKILSALPRSAREAMHSLEPVTLRRDMVLYEPEQHINHVYFPNDAMVSILSVSEDGNTMEIGNVGCEGMVGVPAILGGVTPYRAVVQIGGRALRMKGRNLAEEFRNNSTLHDLL